MSRVAGSHGGRIPTSADSPLLSAAIGIAADSPVVESAADAAHPDEEPGEDGGLTGFARRAVEQTRQHLTRSHVGGTEAVAHLAQARALLDAALDEVMAEALLGGASMRAVAERAGIAPNTVPPRLGRTVTLGSYRGDDGRVLAEGVIRARYERSLTRLAASLFRKGEAATRTHIDLDSADPIRFRRRGA